ncbi:uncharacterized protein LOC128972136 isoform X1 [Indicator indicator]|uniref:uncharacterized protein LOC128972136 isoform X1 n=1 Tax=Indicator indicator TaxID=1002788 RepID=UPI0023DFFC6D|nr:uncharacterized protein LOC128972136 isoform X1 [Indicator indicator]
MWSSWRHQEPSSSTSSFRGSSPMSSSMSSSSGRQYEKIQFRLHKSIPGHGKVFSYVAGKEKQPGDIVLVPIDDWVSHYSFLKHAAVYLGDGEVIHFQRVDDENDTGLVSKSSFQAAREAGGKFQIWRKRGGINLGELRRKVREAMNSETKYYTDTNNCIHFVLWLLGLADFYRKPVEMSDEEGNEEALQVQIPKEEGKQEAVKSSSERKNEAIQFLKHKRIGGKVFDDVPERDIQPGDILIFPMKINASICCVFKHAAVYLGDGEVIHFQGLADRTNTGVVSKQGFHTMKKASGTVNIWRKRDGIKVSELHGKVWEAMNSKFQYHPDTNNCIHFALWLLTLENFYMQLVEILDENNRGKP